jgi:hypothetical protein
VIVQKALNNSCLNQHGKKENREQILCSASDKETNMKKLLIVCVLIAVASLFAVPGIAQQGGVAVAGAPYNASTLYTGEFKADMLYCKDNPTDPEWRRIRHFDRLYKVTCQDALGSLKSSGTWQGHLNFKDGSCASVSEPAQWITGNRRNYDRLRNGDGER